LPSSCQKRKGQPMWNIVLDISLGVAALFILAVLVRVFLPDLLDNDYEPRHGIPEPEPPEPYGYPEPEPYYGGAWPRPAVTETDIVSRYPDISTSRDLPVDSYATRTFASFGVLDMRTGTGIEYYRELASDQERYEPDALDRLAAEPANLFALRTSVPVELPAAVIDPDYYPEDLASCGHVANEDGECDCSYWPERAPLVTRRHLALVPSDPDYHTPEAHEFDPWLPELSQCRHCLPETIGATGNEPWEAELLAEPESDEAETLEQWSARLLGELHEWSNREHDRLYAWSRRVSGARIPA
jgi:hypothetical protein